MSEPERSWAESAMLDATSADGRTGICVRIARYPVAKVAWLWVYLFRPDGVLAYHDDTLPLTGFRGETDVDAEEVTYALPGVNARLTRRGGRLAVTAATCDVAALLQREPAAAGEDRLSVRITASLQPRHQAPSTMPGRSEAFGDVHAEIVTPAGPVMLDSLGHWHEQSGPRGQGAHFARPFTHAILYGERLSLVVTAWEQRTSGFVIRDGETVAVTDAVFDPPGEERHFRLTLADGGVLDGSAEAHHRYATPIDGVPRPGSIVHASTDLGPIAGQINDWRPA